MFPFGCYIPLSTHPPNPTPESSRTPLKPWSCSLTTYTSCHHIQPSGRLSVPYVLLYYLPTTCNNEMRMMYAGAKELMRNTSEVGRVFDIEASEDLEELPQKLGAA